MVKAAAAGVGGVAALPYLMFYVGFTSAGIVAGSWAAKLMGWSAVLNGGGVPAGGFVAYLQSLGAVGVKAKLGGGFGAGILSKLLNFCSSKGKKNPNEK